MTEGSNESNNANLCYDATRQELIRTAPWNCCSATATLALLKSAPGTLENPASTATTWNSATAPPPGWSYEYAYPADCLRARKLVINYMLPQGGAVPLFPFATGSQLPFWDLPGQRFQVTTDVDGNGDSLTCVLANIDQAILCYLRDITIEDLWDPLFTDAMVAALGGKLALPLTGDKQLQAQQYKIANEKAMQARGADANEGLTVINHEPDWITAGHGIRWMGPSQFGSGYMMPFGSLF